MDNNEETVPDPGLTIVLPPEESRLLRDLWRSMMAPSMQACMQVLIRKAYTQQFIEKKTEERPLVSIGQGEYRRDIMPEDC